MVSLFTLSLSYSLIWAHVLAIFSFQRHVLDFCFGLLDAQQPRLTALLGPALANMIPRLHFSAFSPRRAVANRCAVLGRVVAGCSGIARSVPERSLVDNFSHILARLCDILHDSAQVSIYCMIVHRFVSGLLLSPYLSIHPSIYLFCWKLFYIALSRAREQYKNFLAAKHH